MSRAHMPSVAALAAFESAARYGSISRAAEELHLTQGAVSRQIRQLEAQVGTALFHRLHQRVSLTDAGRGYLEEVRQALDALDAATQRTMAYGGGQNVLKLAVPPTFSATWLANRLPQFLNANPAVTINCLMRVPWLDYGAERFDAAIYFGKPAATGVSAQRIVETAVHPLCGPGFRSAHRIETAADLAQVPLLHQTNQPSAWAEWLAKAGVPAPAGVLGSRFEHVGMICRAAVMGLGVALLPACLVEEEMASGALVEVLPDIPRGHVEFYLAVPEGRTMSPAVRAFTEWILGAGGA
jgi:LysR family transcriptional regulator, glycine cleavage system transcriptional activator